MAPAIGWKVAAIGVVSQNDPVFGTPPGWSLAHVTHSAVAFVDAPNGVFFGRNLRFEAAVAKTLKSGFLRRGRIRTIDGPTRRQHHQGVSQY